jgi:hypothetical protein
LGLISRIAFVHLGRALRDQKSFPQAERSLRESISILAPIVEQGGPAWLRERLDQTRSEYAQVQQIIVDAERAD